MRGEKILITGPSWPGGFPYCEGIGQDKMTYGASRGSANPRIESGLRRWA